MPEITLRVLGQLEGENEFTWFRSETEASSAARECVAELIQQHIWNAPEDAKWLQNWRVQVNNWFDGSELGLELHKHNVQPVAFPMMILARQ